jgi:hypothetical protein
MGDRSRKSKRQPDAEGSEFNSATNLSEIEPASYFEGPTPGGSASQVAKNPDVDLTHSTRRDRVARPPRERWISIKSIIRS